jgi:cellulose synthase (UDP-forming)
MLPMAVRDVRADGQGYLLGCRFNPVSAQHHRLIADLIYANSAQWSQFQQSRRVNIGVVRGTFWFLRLAIYQTGRGLAYFVRQYTRSKDATAPAAAPTGN